MSDSRTVHLRSGKSFNGAIVPLSKRMPINRLKKTKLTINPIPNLIADPMTGTSSCTKENSSLLQTIIQKFKPRHSFIAACAKMDAMIKPSTPPPRPPAPRPSPPPSPIPRPTPPPTPRPTQLPTPLPKNFKQPKAEHKSIIRKSFEFLVIALLLFLLILAAFGGVRAIFDGVKWFFANPAEQELYVIRKL